ncbi:MAG: hypothetical protein AB6733_09465 [Clostridiaceae bacterium]
MEYLEIDGDELNQFILDKARKRGHNISLELVELILDLEMEFLQSNGIASESQE